MTIEVQSLKEQWTETIAGKGGCCPVCDRFGKVYKYKMSQSLAQSLKWIVDNGGTNGWVHVQQNAPRWMMRSKTYPLLEHWGLIESQGGRSGVWRATQAGRDFVVGGRLAPSAVYVYDDKLMAVDASHTTFTGCFDVNFNFEELMAATLNEAELGGDTDETR